MSAPATAKTHGFGNRCRNTRELRGLSITEVARAINCSRSQLKQIEESSQPRGISIAKCIELARLYKVPVGYLIAGEVQTGIVIVADSVDNPVQVLEQVVRDRVPERREIRRKR